MIKSPDSASRAHHVAITAALAAGTYARARLRSDFRIEHKSELEVVSEVDREAERLVVEHIRAAFPKDGILAEEAGAQMTREGARWIIDPIDGTTNYVHGFPHYSVSIAREVDGELQVGVVYDPTRDELFEAIQGGGARVNGRPLRVSSQTDIGQALIATGFPYERKLHIDTYLEIFKAVLMRCQELRRLGSSALDFAWIAAGRLDAYWEFGLKPWDLAAGMLLVEEAGGKVVDRSGQRARLVGRIHLAGNAELVDTLVSLMATLPPTPPRAKE